MSYIPFQYISKAARLAYIKVLSDFAGSSLQQEYGYWTARVYIAFKNVQLLLVCVYTLLTLVRCTFRSLQGNHEAVLCTYCMCFCVTGC